MEKVYNISELRFEKGFLILTADDQIIKLRLKDISKKLSNASDHELKDFKISPSGYGIHWRLLDEDLSVDGLLKLNQEKTPRNYLPI